MRKSLMFFALLLILAAAGLAAAHGVVGAMSDDVAVTETTLFGDPAAARGLTVSLHTDYEDHLFWRTVCAAGAELEPVTSFTFSAARIGETKPAYEYVYLETGGVNFSIHGSNLDPNDLYGSAWSDTDGSAPNMTRPVADVAGRTPAGETYTETVRLRDYYEYYTVGLISSTMETLGAWVRLDQQNLQELTQYFRIPVGEEQTEVSVSKDADGAIYEVYCNTSGGGGGVSSEGVVTDQGFYLILCSEADEETGQMLQDFSEIAGGYGVYWIPVDRAEAKALDVRTDRIQNVYPLDPAIQAVRLVAGQDGRLLLFTREEGRLVLTVLDTEAGTPLQRLPLPTGAWPAVYQTENLLILQVWDEQDRLLALTQEDGVYDLWMDAPMLPETETERPYYYFDDPQFTFDGRRLAMACFEDYSNTPSLRLLVYGPTGLAYAGRYDHNGSGGPLRMDTDWSDALVLSWD